MQPGGELPRLLQRLAQRVEVGPRSHPQARQERCAQGSRFSLWRLQHRQTEQVGLQLSTRFTEHWSAQVANLRNLDADEGDLRWSASVVYSDECLIAGLYFVRTFVGDRDNPPDTAVFLRLVFRTLGEFAPSLF